jgi:ubiquinone/menaquinone biosynthesis C-methylase UbiE/uncharacterized protein YbaR (Trm112 family)
MNRREQDVVVCPSCHRQLADYDHALMCEACGRRWDVLGEGIPSFASRDFYWGQISRDKVSRLLLLTREKGYRQALESVLLPETDQYTFRYALDESRSDFKFLLPISARSRVLDIGCGWGAVTVGMARCAGEVWAVDSTLETLNFVRLRAEQERLSNIHLLHVDCLDFGQLPLPAGYFDVVLLNGVLEWVGVQRTDISPREVQILALREIHRVLKPDGTLYVGIENRYSYTYFGGSPDHPGLPFTSLMPRWMASLLLRLACGRSYRTYTYSRRGYARLLEEGGFAIEKFLVPLPSYREPNYMMDLDHRPSLEFFLQYLILESDAPSRRRKYAIRLSRQLVRLGLFSAFCPSFSIISLKVA